ncbi:MAG: sigma-54 dependent transcriptional regulator [bacterium]|nr:sigma-54 dependent transcriptional regulator [Candidatus Sumerlaeota bacterium]
MKPLVAVVDDDAAQRGLLRRALEEAGYAVVEGENGREALEVVRSFVPAALILDVRMPVMDGLETLRQLAKQRLTVPVILLTAFIDVRDAVAAIKAGARDYLEKPVDLDELVTVVDEALGMDRTTALANGEAPLGLPSGIVAESPAARAAFREALRAAPTEVIVLVTGESGTGKEIAARFIHDNSPRRAGPFVALNCAALPENLIESELFGYERGAFTGATEMRRGRFEEASGGTLFLDEIGEMPVALQPKLLRVLEERTIRRIGVGREIPIDVRILSATNRDLKEAVGEKCFREDLLYRLNVFAVHLPTLRERRDDILLLADRFLGDAGTGAKRFSPAAQRLLLDYRWPGNVRELRNAVIRSAIMARGTVIMPEDLPETLRYGVSNTAPEDDDQGGAMKQTDATSLEEIQKRAIHDALRRTSGNKTRAAELLGISRRNLIYKLRSYGL